MPTKDPEATGNTIAEIVHDKEKLMPSIPLVITRTDQESCYLRNTQESQHTAAMIHIITQEPREQPLATPPASINLLKKMEIF